MIVTNLSKTIAGKDLLNKINFIIDSENKIGLIGKNGVGKSTLLKILSGILPADSGEINLNGETIKLLAQEIEQKDWEQSIINYIKKESGILYLETKLHTLEINLDESNMEEYGKLLEQFLKIDGYNFEANLKSILNGLNFVVNLDKKIKTLSGGQKIKVLLAVLLLSDADILLLDEPTNNLDLDSIEWLENYLIQSHKKMIIVSHDESFLNNITNKTFELEDGHIVQYNLRFSEYLKYKEMAYEKELKEHEKVLEQRKEIKKSIQEIREWSNKGLTGKKKDNDKIAANFSTERTKKTSSKASKLTRELERIETNPDFRKKESINFFIEYSGMKGNGDIYINDLVCGYEDFQTSVINIDIKFGNRIQISGKNGSGKSTFIKTLLGELKPLKGQVHIGNEIKIGYISQESLSSDNSNLSIQEYVINNTEIDKSMVFTILNNFGINYEDRNKPYNILSPGQRTRINLAKLAISGVNVLIFDEATNHLDLEAIKVLEEVVDNFDGTIISISHNRSFNQHLNPDIILNIEDGSITYRNEIDEKQKSNQHLFKR